MNRTRLLAMVVLVTALGGLLVGWIGVLAVGGVPGVPNTVGIALVAVVVLTFAAVLAIRRENRRDGSF